MLYLVAFFLPPVALLFAGKPFQALFSLCLYALSLLLLFLFVLPGVVLWLILVVHAILVISGRNQDIRYRKMAETIAGKGAAG